MYRSNIQIVVVFILFFIAVNMLFLDIVVFSNTRPKESISVVTNTPLVVSETTSCPTACQTMMSGYIDAHLASESSTIVVPQQNIIKSQSKEFYIPLGVGTTRSNQYEELFGAEATIDSRNYGSIKQVTFEVFLRNPTGNGRVWAKLFNVTDKHDVWYSEVFMEGSSVTRKEAVINVEPGNKLYRVMLKSSLGYDAYVDAARIKIVTQ